jgi:hypothetical protein
MGGKNVNLPTDYTLTLQGDVDGNLDDIRIKEIGPMQLTTINTVTTRSTLDSASKVDAGMSIKVTELPEIRVEMAFRPMRVHMPLHYKLCLTLLGREILTLGFCGESMLITEPNPYPPKPPC